MLGGSSTSNQIVGHGVIAQDDIVLADANCHKSICHSLTVTGARPVYFKPTRNGYGMIGLVPLKRFSPSSVQELIARSPFAAGRPIAATHLCGGHQLHLRRALLQRRPRSSNNLPDRFRGSTSTRPGTPTRSFIHIYRERFAMGVPDDMEDRPAIFSVQSTHKMLAAFSMGSMIHVKLSDRAPLDFDQFNEAFMMHGTTSPFYPLIASLDVAAAMMDEPAGPTLMDETLADAISFRQAMSSIAHRLRTASENGDGWFFGIYQPERVTDPATGESILFEDAEDELLDHRAKLLDPQARRRMARLPGRRLARRLLHARPHQGDHPDTGRQRPGRHVAEWGIPAAILTEFLDSRRVEIARTGDYTVLVLFSVGTSKGKWGSLLENLFEFKRLYDYRCLA